MKTEHLSFPAQSQETPAGNANKPQELLRDMAALTQESQQAVNGSITDVVSSWLAAQYAGSVHGELAVAEGPRRLEFLRACIQDLAKLRRGDHTAARIELARKQLDWQRAKSDAKKEKELREWLKRPETRQELFPEPQAGPSEHTNHTASAAKS